MCRFLHVFLLPVYLCAADELPLDSLSQAVIAEFGEGAGEWGERRWKADGAPLLEPLERIDLPGDEAGTPCLELPLSLPGKHEFVAPVSGSWAEWDALRFEVFLPAGLPDCTMVTVFTKDRDHLWRQVRLPLPVQRDTYARIEVPIAGEAAHRLWEARGHERTWHQLTSAQLLEYGCSFELDTGCNEPFAGSIGLRRVVLLRHEEAANAPLVRDVQFVPRSPRVGQLCELSFRYTGRYTDPFDPAHVRVQAEIQRPDGETDTVRGFYYEDFLYDREITDKTLVLQPYGAPCFKVRYLPRVTGLHTLRIQAEIEGRMISLPELDFQALTALPGYKGVVQVDPENPRLLAWEDGDPFWGIGLNVRSPYDNRYLKVAPYSTWQDEGLPLYDRLFAEYSKHGIDVVEVWMSSWWLALEWINDSPGFHGVGYYNPYRAWMLDHIIRLAALHDIQIILVFNNHGKFGALNDTEWARNPYNVKNGGFLESCEEYFTDDRAKAAFKQLCDYIVARWGYSANILCWKLFTEIDLTGTSYDYYKKPEVAAWHAEMGDYLTSIDPYGHLITTHWMLGYHRINDEIAVLPQLDLLTTDAYYQGAGAQRTLLKMLRDGARYAAGKNKPLLITEFGGSPHADSMGNLIKQAHLGIWTGFFHEAPAAPMFWWFALVDEKSLYPYYAALRAYSAGEDRRALTSTYVELTDVDLAVNEMRHNTRLYIWAFDMAYYYSEEENLTPREVEGVVLKRPALAAGDYDVQIWNCRSGEIEQTQSLTIEAGQANVELPLPRFTLDIAVKILPVSGP